MARKTAIPGWSTEMSLAPQLRAALDELVETRTAPLRALLQQPAGGEAAVGGAGAESGPVQQAATNTITGTDAANILNGGAADDLILGLDGDDSLYGGSGADTLLGATGLDTLLGEDGTDTLYGGNERDVAYGGTGNDLLQGDDAGPGSSGNDYLDGGIGDDTLFGGPGNDDLQSHVGNDTAFGGLGDDNFNGNTNSNGSNSLTDTLYGGSGNDVAGFRYLAEDRIVFYGGSGYDFFQVVSNGVPTAPPVVWQLRPVAFSPPGTPLQLLTSSADAGSYDHRFSLDVERLRIAGRAVSDTLYISGSLDASALQLVNFEGNDGDDVLWHDPGVDPTSVSFNANLDVYSGSGADTVWTFSGDDVARGGAGDDTVFTNDGDDVLYGAANVDSLYGGSGDDYLEGGNSGDLMDGGAGLADVVSYAVITTAGAGVVVDLSDNLTEIGNIAQGDFITRVERIEGGTNNDRITGNSGANVLWGLAGSDTLAGLTGADSLDGGNDQDWVNYAASAAGVTIGLAGGTLGFGGDAAGDTLARIEHVIGSSFGDYISGDDSETVGNTLLGRDGNDTLRGLAGADSLVGGSGQDFLSYQNSNLPVFVRLSTREAAGGHATGDWYTGVEHVIGSGGADTLGGDSGSNTLFGDVAPDTLLGDTGADSLIGGVGSDTLDYQLSDAAVTIDLGDNEVEHGGHAEGDFVTQAEHIGGSHFDDTLTGNNELNFFLAATGNDTLFGASGNDSINGGQGDDTLIGGSGADRQVGAAGSNDWSSWHTSAGGMTLDLANGNGYGGEAQGDFLTLVEHLRGSLGDDRLTGLDGQFNSLRGDEGNDSLHGASGADALFGEAGNDVVFFDAADSAIMGHGGRDTLVGTVGADLVQMSQAKYHAGGAFAAFEQLDLGDGSDYYLGSDLGADFNAILGGGVTVNGNTGNDYISFRGNNATQGIDDYASGGIGNDAIWGGAGRDTLYGGGHDDQLYGGLGDDTLSGGAGFDVSYIGRNEGSDTLVDSEGLVLFWGNDALLNGPVYDGVDPSEIAIAYGASTVTITYDSGGSVTFAKGAVQVLNLFDYGNGDAGNSGAPPPAYARNIWSAEWNAGSQTFSAFTLAVDG
jgi:Ca2+-binding RTX toxin-like protein